MSEPNSHRSKLEALRGARDLSRSKVAADLDISERHLYRLERGETKLRRRWLLAFASYYGVDADSLRGNVEEVAA